MKNFGKLTAYPETLVIQDEIKNDDGEIVTPRQEVNILTLKDGNGVIWHDLFKHYPHKYYIAVNEENRIITMTDDPEQCQLPDHIIIGLDEDFNETFGPGGSVYGKIWNGKQIAAPEQVLPSLTSRQFWQAALVIGVTEDSLVANIDTKDSPLYIADNEERESAMIDIRKATTFNRDYPLIVKMAEVNNIPETQLDTLWQWAAHL